MGRASNRPTTPNSIPPDNNTSLIIAPRRCTDAVRPVYHAPPLIIIRSISERIHGRPSSHQRSGLRIPRIRSIHRRNIRLKLLLLGSRIPHKRAQRNRIVDKRRHQNLHARPHCSRALVPFFCQNVGHPVQRDADCAQAQAEKAHQKDFALKLDARLDQDRDGEDDEQQVGEDAAGCHDEKVRVGLPALPTGVGTDLPVVGYREAFGEVADEAGEKGEADGGLQEAQSEVVTGFASGADEAVEEEEGDCFEGP